LQSSRGSDRIFAGSEFIRGIQFQMGGKAMKINQAISSAILVVLLTAPTAWGQDNIRAAMEAANNEWSAAYNSMNGTAFPALYTKDAILMPPGVQPINGSEAIGHAGLPGLILASAGLLGWWRRRRDGGIRQGLKRLEPISKLRAGVDPL
jgi:hypothetical protein